MTFIFAEPDSASDDTPCLSAAVKLDKDESVSVLDMFNEYPTACLLGLPCFMRCAVAFDLDAKSIAIQKTPS